MAALTFTDWGNGHASAYDPRGEIVGRIAPTLSSAGGYHALIRGADDEAGICTDMVDWFPTVAEAKRGLAAHYGSRR